MVLKLFSQSVFVLAICVVSFAFEKFFCLLFLYRKIYQSSITASEYNSLYFFRRYLLSNYFTFAFFVVSTPSTVRSVGRNRPLPQFWAAALPSRPGYGSFHSPPVSPLPTATSPSVLHKAPRAASVKQESHLTQLRSSGDAPPLALRTEPALLRRALLSVLSFPDFTPPRPARDLRTCQASAGRAAKSHGGDLDTGTSEELGLRKCQVTRNEPLPMETVGNAVRVFMEPSDRG